MATTCLNPWNFQFPGAMHVLAIVQLHDCFLELHKVGKLLMVTLQTFGSSGTRQVQTLRFRFHKPREIT